MASASTQEPATAEARRETFERGVALALHLWPDLTFAVENHLGGPDSAEKRDWFAGAVCELFPAFPAQTQPPQQAQASAEDLLVDAETRLLQIMDDEFDTLVDDGSAYEVAEQAVRLWRECGRGVFREVEALTQRWEAVKGKKVSAMFKQGEEVDQETDGSEDDDDGSDDVEMGDAPPALVTAPKERLPPEVDEDGFTKVTKKKR